MFNISFSEDMLNYSLREREFYLEYESLFSYERN